MTTNEKKTTLKSLRAAIDDLKGVLINNKILVEGIVKKLEKATIEIENVKESQNKASEIICDKCNVLFKSEKGLREHNKKDHPHQVKCTICDEVFKKRSDLETHISSHHESSEKYECKQCDTKFVLKWRLNKHQKIHEKQKNVKCHYFNNGKACPFEDLGCMFEHSY